MSPPAPGPRIGSSGATAASSAEAATPWESSRGSGVGTGSGADAVSSSQGTELLALDIKGPFPPYHSGTELNDDNEVDADDDERFGREAEVPAATEALLGGWRQPNFQPSLAEVHSTVRWPERHAPWYKKVFALAGVGFMISVAYMDPGNWATDLAGGSAYGYTLLAVVLLSNITAVFLQSLSLKLGVVAERDLAQACRDAYPKQVVYVLWLIVETAIAATDLAEVIGSATALYLLFGIPIWAGVLITAVDTLFILLFGMKSFRVLEVVVGGLALLIAIIFAYELAVVKPSWIDVAKGFIPKGKILTNPNILYTAISIMGATVMPHSLYLHSSIIQTRSYPRTKEGKKAVIKYARWDSSVSLLLAFFVNSSILILAAAAFYYGTNPNRSVESLTEAYKLLEPALGGRVAKILFAVGLLASGQNSTIIGTLSGQIVMEGFLRIRIRPWIRRAITRGIAIIPAAITAGVGGDAAAGKLLVLSQVILSLALSFAVVPLVHFTSSKAKMGPAFVNGVLVKIAATTVACAIAGLNIYLLYSTIKNGEFGTSGDV